MSLLNIFFIIVLISSHGHCMDQKVQSENHCLLFLELPHDINAEILHLILPNHRFSDPIQALKSFKQALPYLRVNKRWRKALQNTWIVKQQIEYLHHIVNSVLAQNASFFNSFCPDHRDYIKAIAQYDLSPLAQHDFTNNFNNKKDVILLYLKNALEHNALNVLKFLFDNYKKEFNINAKIEEKTLLYLAVASNSYGATELLLKQQANPNKSTSDLLGLTPLHTAAEKNAIALAQLLIKHSANVNAKTKCSATALHYAVYYKSYEVAHLLLENGAKTSIKTNCFNNTLVRGFIIPYYIALTPLEIAEAKNDERMINLLKSYKKKCIIQ